MLRLETETGWWLVTHPDHARLAGAFAEHWGNDRFLPPEPRANVLRGIARHDDGWAARDAAPQITRQGKPSAFSVELVGKYSAFEEIDLADYLAVRDRAVRLIAAEDPYAAMLISMHTYSLLTEHADRSTIAPADLPLLDQFLEQQKAFQQSLRGANRCRSAFAPEQKSEAAILDHFRLLQASDNLSLLTCVDFRAARRICCTRCRCATAATPAWRCARPARATSCSIPTRSRSLRLSFRFRRGTSKARLFSSAAELQAQFAAAPVETLSVTVSAG